MEMEYTNWKFDFRLGNAELVVSAPVCVEWRTGKPEEIAFIQGEVWENEEWVKVHSLSEFFDRSEYSQEYIRQNVESRMYRDLHGY